MPLLIQPTVDPEPAPEPAPEPEPVPTVGQVVDRLGVTADPGAPIVTALVVFELADGQVVTAPPPGLSWSAQLGLLDAARIRLADPRA